MIDSFGGAGNDAEWIVREYVDRMCDDLDEVIGSSDVGTAGVLVAESFRDVALMLMDCGRINDAAAVCALVECLVYGAGDAALSALARVVKSARPKRRPIHPMCPDPEAN